MAQKSPHRAVIIINRLRDIRNHLKQKFKKHDYKAKNIKSYISVNDVVY